MHEHWENRSGHETPVSGGAPTTDLLNRFLETVVTKVGTRKRCINTMASVAENKRTTRKLPSHAHVYITKPNCSNYFAG